MHSESKGTFKIEAAVLCVFLLACFLQVFTLDQLALAYTQGDPEHLKEARNLTFSKIISKISSGGVSGNLGVTLMLTFSGLLPLFVSLFLALRYRHNLLKVVQFPALICIGFGAAVLFLQPERWFSGSWAEEFTGFAFFVGLGSGLVSAFLLRSSGWRYSSWVFGSLAAGFLVYSIRSLL